MQVLEGRTLPAGRRFAVVASRFNDAVTRRLADGCVKTLRGHGVKERDLTVAWVPGAFELPLVARNLALTGRYAAVITLGAVIRGETSHYDLVCNEAAAGVSAVSRDTGVPCIFGVLTTDTVRQAMARAGTRANNNKGAESAEVALRMADLLPRLGARPAKRRSR